MGWKEKLEEKRQREEAKRYFRSNNPYYFSNEMWMKLIVTGLFVSLGCGIAYGLFTMLIHIQFSYILALIGVVIAKALRKVAGVGNEKLGILTVVLYFVSLVFSNVVSIAIYYLMLGGNIAGIFSPGILLSALTSLFSGSMISSIFYLFGAIYAYNIASN